VGGPSVISRIVMRAVYSQKRREAQDKYAKKERNRGNRRRRE
jgi:hypothetical protein